MLIGLRLIGALVVTYLLSRGLVRILKAERNSVRLAAAHAASLLIVALVLGILRAYWSEFEWTAALIYVGPQILWFVLDYVRLSKRS